MTVGVVMLVHTALDRAEHVIRHWVSGGCPVVVHVDQKVADATYDAFVKALSDLEDVKFSTRHKCEWGMWGLVAATQDASELMLKSFAQVRHVYLASGSCMPLRPVSELRSYLDSRPNTDFIESATTAEVSWTMGGLDAERFTLRFPFSWRKHKRLFDAYVTFQRRLRMSRKIPDGLVPHMGSQWWCLTRHTLSAILQDPGRQEYDRYFKRVWIPDESYFQTLSRLYSSQIESRSLTLSKFDFQGKPHIFYDDHLQLLRRSDCFVARKIWPNATRLYHAFLNNDGHSMKRAEPNPAKIDRVFSTAIERRTKGRAGLYMQSRFPNWGRENGVTSSVYGVFEGFTELYEDFEPWLAKATGARVHGHLYHPDRVEFDGRQAFFQGAMSSNAAQRDYNPEMFLTNLIWNTRGERQAFQFGPDDTQKAHRLMARDQNARISVISGAWAIPLYLSNLSFTDIRRNAARLQNIETAHLALLQEPDARAHVRIWSLAEFIENPMEALQTVVDEMAGKAMPQLTQTPRMVDLTGFGQFLQNLKNQGMHPYLMGNFPVDDMPRPDAPTKRKPYLVKSQ
jgi:hypothetical protein